MPRASTGWVSARIARVHSANCVVYMLSMSGTPGTPATTLQDWDLSYVCRSHMFSVGSCLWGGMRAQAHTVAGVWTTWADIGSKLCMCMLWEGVTCILSKHAGGSVRHKWAGARLQCMQYMQYMQ